MNEIKISDDLYQFNIYLNFIDLSFNQYLLLGKEPFLFIQVVKNKQKY